MFGNLRLHGVEMLAVPRTPDGPDIAVLEKLAAARRPKAYFTQSVMHNPTGTDMSPHVAFKLLQAAERHNFIVVEDDIFCDLQAKATPRLATLDQLDRVIYARSFSKTLSGTSAYHMPRAVGVFRKAGFAVEPYPVDWRTRGAQDELRPFASVGDGLRRVDTAVREWVGLAVYWLTGRSSELFPGPLPAAK